MDIYQCVPLVTRRLPLAIDQVRFQTTSPQGLEMLGDVADGCGTVLRTATWKYRDAFATGTLRGFAQRTWLPTMRIECCFTAWSAATSEISVRYDVPWTATVQLRQRDFDRLHSLAEALVHALTVESQELTGAFQWSESDDLDLRELVFA